MSGPPADVAGIAAECTDRGITEVLHFTTSHGLLGVLTLRELRSRDLLTSDDYLEQIYRPNANSRYEAPSYWRYVNMSIGVVNERFFRISQRWHASDEGLFWAILHFQPVLLAHPGVLFSPGNMGYAGMEPAQGYDGFTALFADGVPAGFGQTMARRRDRAADLPTNPQAEVLYPDRLSTEYLFKVTVADDEDAASVEAVVRAIDHPDVQVVVDPEMFQQ